MPVRLLDKRLLACLFVLQVIVTARLGSAALAGTRLLTEASVIPKAFPAPQERGERPKLLQGIIELPCFRANLPTSRLPRTAVGAASASCSCSEGR